MLLGLTGKPQTGKSEVAKILVSKYGFTLIDTKDKLREIVSEITGISYSTLQSSLGKEQLYKGVPVRKIMGNVGLCLEDMFGVDYLPSEALKAYKGGNAVLDSLRLQQSAFFKGKVIEVKSDRTSGTNYNFDKYDKKDICYKLDNSGDFGTLEKNIKIMLDKLNK